MMATDPICGMEVSENTEKKLIHNGKTYYFCGLSCLRKFAEQHNIELEKEQKFSWFSLIKNKVIIITLVLGLLVGITTGFAYQFLENRDMVEKQPPVSEDMKSFSIKADIKKRMSGYSFTISRLKNDIKGIFFGAVSLGNMVLWWILLGMGLASLAGAYVPSAFFQDYLGPSFLGLVITLGFATVIEVCSEGSAPMAFELFKQTGALGNSFTFLMAGVATDYTEIGLLWSNVGKRTALWLPVITVPQVLLLGWFANTFL